MDVPGARGGGGGGGGGGVHDDEGGRVHAWAAGQDEGVACAQEEQTAPGHQPSPCACGRCGKGWWRCLRSWPWPPSWRTTWWPHHVDVSQATFVCLLGGGRQDRQATWPSADPRRGQYPPVFLHMERVSVGLLECGCGCGCGLGIWLWKSMRRVPWFCVSSSSASLMHQREDTLNSPFTSCGRLLTDT